MYPYISNRDPILQKNCYVEINSLRTYFEKKNTANFSRLIYQSEYRTKNPD